MVYTPVKNVRRGDRIALDDGVGVVVACERFNIVDAAPKLGGAYTIQWREESGEMGQQIVAGLDEVDVVDDEKVDHKTD
jgi:hypothetical protein